MFSDWPVPRERRGISVEDLTQESEYLVDLIDYKELKMCLIALPLLRNSQFYCRSEPLSNLEYERAVLTSNVQ